MMKSLDYMKVIDIVSKLFQADRKVDLKASHEKKIDIFEIQAKCHDGRKLAYHIHLKPHEMDVIIPKKSFESKKFSKWISQFEYEMEQTFFRNVKIDVHEEAIDYRIVIIM